jgi:hypothetical protein
MWYMGLDNQNKPNGWDNKPWGTAIEVTQTVRDIHELHPDYIWNGITLTAPPQAEPYIPTPQELILQQINTIEQQITIRRNREAILGIDNGWLADINTQIAILRGEL